MMKTQEDLIREEQAVLDKLIDDMDLVLLEKEKTLSYKSLQAKKEKEKCLPDTYGSLVSAEYDKKILRKQIRETHRARNELYGARIVVEYEDKISTGEDEIKIGLHTYIGDDGPIIMNWKTPLCRHFMLNDSVTEYNGEVEDKFGKYHTHYVLKLKRIVDMIFDEVKEVTHFYPIDGEEFEKIISDEFLQELLNRRSEQEFQNIVFSIQKHQGEIIQTPFQKNLIVQGCAGSGKSMIMLHRLPIILYDNPNSLKRANLYIITPSITYIQMAQNMRMDLEIEDLEMGTLEQYYDHVIQKYRRRPEEYGRIKPFVKLSPELQKYVYSEQCITDIEFEIKNRIESGKVDCTIAYEILGIQRSKDTGRIKTNSDVVQAEILALQNVLNENNKNLKIYYRNGKILFDYLDDLARFLETRKLTILRAIDRLIAVREQKIVKARKELEKIDKEIHKTMYENRIQIITDAQVYIEKQREIKEVTEYDDEYFSLLSTEAEKIRQLLLQFKAFQSEEGKNDTEMQYQFIENRFLVCELCTQLMQEIEDLEDPYLEYVAAWSPLIKKVRITADLLQQTNEAFLPLEQLQPLIEKNKYLSDLRESMISDIYFGLMQRLGQTPDEKGRFSALKCSPYLYLQILYAYYGLPIQREYENLITIDEAQNIAPEELRLIKKVNNNNVVLNLFGDVKQHVEESKGIDSWEEFGDIASFQVQNMRENYRNARQITEYCNKRFGLQMRAINLDGKGVHEIKEVEDFNEQLFAVFQRPQNVGLSCILVKNAEEADSIMEKAVVYQNRIQDMTKEGAEIKKNKWNLMTVEQAKGLEFETVFAVSGRMSMNEKYIAYTRALDELYVFDVEMLLNEKMPADTKEQNYVDEVKIEGTKREKRKSKKEKINTSSDGVKEFFENAGMKVIDDRHENGSLWVIGKQEEIEPVVNKAIDKFNIFGEYGAHKKAGFKSGWHTKTKR